MNRTIHPIDARLRRSMAGVLKSLAQLATKSAPTEPVTVPTGSGSTVLKSETLGALADVAKSDTESELRPAASGVSSKISGATIGGSRGTTGLVEFNLSDIATQGREQLEKCRDQVHTMLDTARKQAEQIKEDAYQEGLANAIQKANQDVDRKISQQADAKTKQQLASLQLTVKQMRTQYETWMQQYAEVLTETSMAAAEHLTRSELSRSTDASGSEADSEEPVLVRWAREALHSTRSAGRLTVVVHPDTLAELGGALDELLADPSLPETSSVVPDESLGLHDVIVRQDGGEIHAGLDAQLDRLREELH
ncbi:MAG: flagellar assembly protein FliH [Rubripirellula sp.]